MHRLVLPWDTKDVFFVAESVPVRCIFSENIVFYVGELKYRVYVFAVGHCRSCDILRVSERRLEPVRVMDASLFSAVRAPDLGQLRFFR